MFYRPTGDNLINNSGFPSNRAFVIILAHSCLASDHLWCLPYTLPLQIQSSGISPSFLILSYFSVKYLLFEKLPSWFLLTHLLLPLFGQILWFSYFQVNISCQLILHLMHPSKNLIFATESHICIQFSRQYALQKIVKANIGGLVLQGRV